MVELSYQHSEFRIFSVSGGRQYFADGESSSVNGGIDKFTTGNYSPVSDELQNSVNGGSISSLRGVENSSLIV